MTTILLGMGLLLLTLAGFSLFSLKAPKGSTEFAGTLYNFEQVRREMDCIRGRSTTHGKISVKRFLYALAALCSGHPA